ncbi:N-acetyltransferase family protein [uncultured Muriicola sp.]|uniref:GNAT family N-acetyltransferase n=1 Tax=uncultured Muriicola sp. TaxID=1583102 RepID=UPI00345BB41C
MAYFVGAIIILTIMKNVRIREAVESDLATLLQFEQALIEAERPFDPTIRTGHLHYYDLKEFITNKEAMVVVAEVDGQIVSSGFGIAKTARSYLDHEQYAYLGFMYTLAEYRGQGINGKIVEVDPAIIAYEKVGFKKHIIEMRISSDNHESQA